MNSLSEFANYLREEGRSENTVASYTWTVKLFFKRYSEITNETVILYKKYLMDNFKPKTVNVRLNSISAYAVFMSLPIKKPKCLKVHRQISVENVISPDEFNRLCEGLKQSNTRGYWIVNYLAKTGARASEFVRLTKKALENGYEEMFTKGKIRRIYIPKKLIEESKDYFLSVQGSLLFPGLRSHGQMTKRGLSANLKNYGARFGIRKEVMHPHGFRHFYAKEFLRKGGDLSLLCDLLGHENIGTTAIYTRCTSDEMAEKLSQLMM